MPHPRFHSFAILVCLAWSLANAAPAPPAVRAEIDALLRALQSSGCQFNRNGSWYSGAEAQAFLTKKLEHLERKSLVKSSEDFISLGASTSSSSGKTYLVRCGSAQPVESRTWLGEQLSVQRQRK